jgi:hypothetical protein
MIDIMVKKIKPGANRIYREEKKPTSRKYKSVGIFDAKLKKMRRAGSKFQSLLNY